MSSSFGSNHPPSTSEPARNGENSALTFSCHGRPSNSLTSIRVPVGRLYPVLAGPVRHPFASVGNGTKVASPYRVVPSVPPAKCLLGTHLAKTSTTPLEGPKTGLRTDQRAYNKEVIRVFVITVHPRIGDIGGLDIAELPMRFPNDRRTDIGSRTVQWNHLRTLRRQ